MANADPLKLRDNGNDAPDVHVYGHGIVCATDSRGAPKNRNVDMNKIVVGLGNFIPLWASDVTLYWRFDKVSFQNFDNPTAAKARIRDLFQAALGLWADASPVRFAYREDGADFDFVLESRDDCNARGCVLASAFFPEPARNKLNIYPRMLKQKESEQVETLVHELGHVFGLRHFFANVSETQTPSEIFGTHVRFSIMNYGAESKLTEADKSDLKQLYELARSGSLRAINGTPIKLMRPASAT
jgi:hypothetical protein